MRLLFFIKGDSIYTDCYTKCGKYQKLLSLLKNFIHVGFKVKLNCLSCHSFLVFFNLKKAIRKKKQNPKRRIINLHKKNFVNVIDHNFDIYDQILSY